MVIIDVSQVGDEYGLHSLLKAELDFPGFYGMNWDAFWDAITGLVELPGHIRFTGWGQLAEHVPCGSSTLRRLLDRYRDEVRPAFVVEYL